MAVDRDRRPDRGRGVRARDVAAAERARRRRQLGRRVLRDRPRRRDRGRADAPGRLLLGPQAAPRPPGAPARDDDGLAEGPRLDRAGGLRRDLGARVALPDHLEHHDRQDHARDPDRARAVRDRVAHRLSDRPQTCPRLGGEPLGQRHAFASRADPGRDREGPGRRLRRAPRAGRPASVGQGQARRSRPPGRRRSRSRSRRRGRSCNAWPSAATGTEVANPSRSGTTGSCSAGRSCTCRWP